MVTWGALEAGARDLAERLRAGAMTRVALAGASPDAILAALLASQQAGCELLLLRSSLPAGDGAWREWNVTGVLDDKLNLTVLPSPGAAAAGFAILLTTSGTTGRPKVARHSLDALLGRIRFHRPSAGRPQWLIRAPAR